MQTKIKTLFIIMALIVKALYPNGTSSSEGANPFNQYMSPQGGINLFSGDVTFSHPLVTISGINGMGGSVALSYSSNIQQNVRTKNDVAPTTWVGLGWSLNYGSIVCNPHGVRGENNSTEYYWISPEGVGQKIWRNTDGTFYLEKNPFWKVEQSIQTGTYFKVLGWILTDLTGKKYVYGSPAKTGYTWTQDNNAVGNALCWGTHPGGSANGYIGNGFGGTPYQYPIQWQLSGIEDIFMNRTEFEYDTIGQILKAGSWQSPSGVFYTKESYLKKIATAGGNTIEFYTVKKDPLEYLDLINYKEEPDGYYDPFQTKALDSIVVKVNGHYSKKYKLCYNFINIFPGEHYKKRLLSSLIEYDDKRDESNITNFIYHDDLNKNIDEENYNYGAKIHRNLRKNGAWV